jgi:hypothetical protein
VMVLEVLRDETALKCWARLLKNRGIEVHVVYVKIESFHHVRIY